MLVVSCRLAGQGTYKLRFGTAANEEPEFVEMLSDGSYLVAGHATGGGGLGGQDALLVKFSAAGTVEWSKVYGGSGNDLFRNIYACSDGNYIAVGETNSFGAGNTGWR